MTRPYRLTPDGLEKLVQGQEKRRKRSLVRRNPKLLKAIARDKVRGLTFQQIAEKHGVSVRSITRWSHDPVMLQEIERLRADS